MSVSKPLTIRGVLSRLASGSLRSTRGTVGVLHFWGRAVSSRFASSLSDACPFRSSPARFSFFDQDLSRIHVCAEDEHSDFFRAVDHEVR